MLKNPWIRFFSSKRKTTLLITSATSGVGLAIIDSLRGRRKLVHLIGVSTDISGQIPLEFDVFLQSPPTESSYFPEFIEEVCNRFKVDLVLAGRDDDLIALGELHDKVDSSVILQSGPSTLIKIFRDKFLAYEWCYSRKLDFADTVSTDSDNLKAEIDSLVVRSGFPLVLKPRRGDGSRGVRILRHKEDLLRAISIPGHVVQGFVGRRPEGELQPNLDLGVPLFWNFPELAQGVIVFILDKNNSTGELSTFEVTHNQGRVRKMVALDDPNLNKFATRILSELMNSGFHGICGFSVMKSSDEQWKIIEINPRFTGGTAARVLLGFDEVAKTLNIFLGRDFMQLRQVNLESGNLVMRRERDLIPTTE